LCPGKKKRRMRGSKVPIGSPKSASLPPNCGRAGVEICVARSRWRQIWKRREDEKRIELQNSRAPARWALSGGTHPFHFGCCGHRSRSRSPDPSSKSNGALAAGPYVSRLEHPPYGLSTLRPDGSDANCRRGSSRLLHLAPEGLARRRIRSARPWSISARLTARLEHQSRHRGNGAGNVSGQI